MKTFLVILLWFGQPPEWQTFKVQMRDAAECHKVAVAYFRTPEADRPSGKSVLLWCETGRDDSVAGNAEVMGDVTAPPARRPAP